MDEKRDTTHAARAETPRRLMIVAGLAAMIAGALRFLLGASNLERVAGGLTDTIDMPYLEASWHGMTATFFLFGIAMILSAWRSRAVARTVALLAAIHFGYGAVILASASAAALGSGFALAPVFALALLCGICLGAGLRAR